MIGRSVNKNKKKLVRFFRKDLPYETVLIDFHSNARKDIIEIKQLYMYVVGTYLVYYIIVSNNNSCCLPTAYSSQSIENARRFGRISQLETTHTHTHTHTSLILFDYFYPFLLLLFTLVS